MVQFLLKVLELSVVGGITLCVGWIHWKKQKRDTIAQQTETERKKYIQNLKVFYKDIKEGLRISISVALSAFSKNDMALRHNMHNRGRIDEIIGFTTVDKRDSLLDDIALIYSHFELINLRINDYPAAGTLIISRWGSPGVKPAHEKQAGIATDIVIHSKWDLINLLPIHNKIIDELEKFGDSTQNRLNESRYNEIFLEFVELESGKTKSEKVFNFTTEKLIRFNKEIGYNFKIQDS